jgi:hypothetical protein
MHLNSGCWTSLPHKMPPALAPKSIHGQRSNPLHSSLAGNDSVQFQLAPKPVVDPALRILIPIPTVSGSFMMLNYLDGHSSLIVAYQNSNGFSK